MPRSRPKQNIATPEDPWDIYFGDLKRTSRHGDGGVYEIRCLFCILLNKFIAVH